MIFAMLLLRICEEPWDVGTWFGQKHLSSMCKLRGKWAFDSTGCRFFFEPHPCPKRIKQIWLMIIDWNHYNDISCICLNIIIISYHIIIIIIVIISVMRKSADFSTKFSGYRVPQPGRMRLPNRRDIQVHWWPRIHWRRGKTWMTSGFKNEHPQETSGNHVFVPIKSGCPVNCFSFKLIHI